MLRKLALAALFLFREDRTLPGVLGAEVEGRADDDSRDKDDEDRGEGGEDGLVATGEEAKLIDDARPAGEDGLAIEIALDVVSEIGSGLVEIGRASCRERV